MQKLSHKQMRRKPHTGPFKKESNVYFTKEHEDAVIKYCISDGKTRNHLYKTLLEPAFNEMIDNIVFTFKFTSLPNIDVLKDECKHNLITILNKFDPARGSKAFSYFSVITKNFFIHNVKKQTKNRYEEVHIDSVFEREDGNDEVLGNTHSAIHVHNPFYEDNNKKEFLEGLRHEMNCWEDEFTTENEKKVYLAFKHIFDNIDSIDILNRKAIYLYIKEITGLETKEMKDSIRKLKNNYGEFKQIWQEEA